MGIASNGAKPRKRMTTRRFLFGLVNRIMKALREMQRAVSILLILIFGLPSVSAYAELPAGTCPPSSPKRLVSVGDVLLQSTKPEAQVEACNGSGRVPERSQQGAVDGKDAEPVF